MAMSKESLEIGAGMRTLERIHDDEGTGYSRLTDN
jgi:hypothetical protein